MAEMWRSGGEAALPYNIAYFSGELKKFGLRKMNPDEFLSELFDEVPDLVIGSLANARRNLSRTRVAASDFIAILKEQKLVQLAKRVEKYTSDL